MRTQLDLDEELHRRLKDLQKVRRTSFEKAVNEALRAGLAVLSDSPDHADGLYATQPWDAGAARLTDVDDIQEVLDIAEGEHRR